MRIVLYIKDGGAAPGVRLVLFPQHHRVHLDHPPRHEDHVISIVRCCDYRICPWIRSVEAKQRDWGAIPNRGRDDIVDAHGFRSYRIKVCDGDKRRAGEA
jgi:hypothetical protein